MPLFFSPKKESECLLALDIGSGSVAGALILPGKGYPPSILYSFRSDIAFQEHATGARLLNLCLRSLSEVMTAIVHEGFERAGFGRHRRIEEAFISLSAPWVISKTSFLSLKSEQPTRITPKVFDELLFHSRQESRIPKGAVTIEQKLIKAVLNGYETASPYEKHAREAEFAVFGSFSLPRVIEKTTETIEQHLHPKRMTFHSFSLLAFAMLRELYPREDSFVLADVSGEQTEVSIVKRGILMETVSFPFGRNRLLRIVGNKSNMPVPSIAAFFRLVAERKGSGPLFERVRRMLDDAQKKWSEQFRSAIASFSEELFVPKSVFLTSDDDVAPLFRHAIENGDFSRYAVSQGAFRLITVDGELLRPLVKWHLGETRDPFLSIIAAAANALRHSTA